MQRSWPAALLITCVGVAGTTTEATAAITQVKPASATRGKLVRITGDGLSGKTLRISVGGKAARVRSASGRSATFSVPRGARFGPGFIRATKRGRTIGSIRFTVNFAGRATLRTNKKASRLATIGPAGGTVRAAGMSLEIPPGALARDTRIRLTPVLSVAGTPLDRWFHAGAQLAPDGLRFDRPARLSIKVPKGARPGGLVGFGAQHNGGDFHLEWADVEDGRAVLDLWHFSSAGFTELSQLTNALLVAMGTYTPSTAETLATQQLAAALAACAREQRQLELQYPLGIPPGIDLPACTTDLYPVQIRTLRNWFSFGVRPKLEAAQDVPFQVFQPALVEYLRWLAALQSMDTSVEEALEGEAQIVRALARSALANQARRRLRNCTGTSLLEQLRDVTRIAGIAQVLAFDTLEDAVPGGQRPLPPPDRLLVACAHLEVDEPVWAPVLARGQFNRLAARASMHFWDAPSRPVETDYELEAPGGEVGPATGTGSTGRFDTRIAPAANDSSVSLRVKATPSSTDIALLTGGAAERVFTRPAAPRLELLPGTGELAPGTTAQVTAQLAGDDTEGRTIAFSMTGPGSLSAPQATTDAGGRALVSLTAPQDTGGETRVTGQFDDAGTQRSSTSVFTIPSSVAVAVSPTSVTLSGGTTQQFTASVTGTPNTSVTWSASGGSVSQTGLYTAPTSAGSYQVTATSVADATKSGTATVTVPPPTPPNDLNLTVEPAAGDPVDDEPWTWFITATNPARYTHAAEGIQVDLTVHTAGTSPSAPPEGADCDDPVPNPVPVGTLAPGETKQVTFTLTCRVDYDGHSSIGVQARATGTDGSSGGSFGHDMHYNSRPPP